MDAAAPVIERFQRFADHEAPGRSALYAEWASGVAGDLRMASVLAAIPATHRQPPLVFAVTRMMGAPEGVYAEWAEWVLAHADQVVQECSRRSLQTNEPLRCAALLPALSGIPGPIALLEVGASAGLCLYPDRYSYRYLGGGDLDPVDGVSSVVLTSTLSAAEGSALPALRLPDVVWRAGIDLEPLDAADPIDRRFLTSLVWPGEHGRVERIEAALDIARAERPLLVRGDATEAGVLDALAALAPAGTTLVVTTPGVLPHIPRAGRDRLFAAIAALDAEWITIDSPSLHAQWNPPLDAPQWSGFVLGRGGVALADVDPLGAFVEWRGGAADRRR